MTKPKRTPAAQTPGRRRGLAKPDLNSLLRHSWKETRTLLRSWDTAHQADTLHLARVAWRRHKCLLKFYQPLLSKPPLHDQATLQTVWKLTGQLRNLDVALDSTLPAWLEAHPAMGGSEWQLLLRRLRQERLHLSQDLALALHTAAVKVAFRRLQRWTQRVDTASKGMTKKLFKPWAMQRLQRLHRKIRAHRHPISPERQHRGRLLLKQERYALESLLSKGRSKKLQKRLHRCRLQQTQQGHQQDLQMALNLITAFGRSPALARAWQKTM